MDKISDNYFYGTEFLGQLFTRHWLSVGSAGIILHYLAF